MGASEFSRTMKGRSITMEPVDWATVGQVAKEFGLSSLSAGVRFIIRDWQRLRGMAEAHSRVAEAVLEGRSG